MLFDNGLKSFPEAIKACIVAFLHFEAWVLFPIDVPEVWVDVEIVFEGRIFPRSLPPSAPDILRHVARLIRWLPHLSKAKFVRLSPAMSRLKSQALWDLLRFEACRCTLNHDLPHKRARVSCLNHFGLLHDCVARSSGVTIGIAWFAVHDALSSGGFSIFVESFDLPTQDEHAEVMPEISIHAVTELAPGHDLHPGWPMSTSAMWTCACDFLRFKIDSPMGCVIRVECHTQATEYDTSTRPVDLKLLIEGTDGSQHLVDSSRVHDFPCAGRDLFFVCKLNGHEPFALAFEL